MENLVIKKRNLPHWTLESAAYFVTFRLRQGQLNQAEIKLVLDHLKFGDAQFYTLIAAVVMPDHVHLLLQPNPGIELSRIMKGIKGASASKINLARSAQGSVWQTESFDRIVRDQAELEEKLIYLFNNPIKRKLTEEGFDYPGSYFNVKG